MKKMVALISALVVLMVAFSGCVGDNKSAVNGTEPNSSGENVNPAESTANVSELNDSAVNVTESSSLETNVNPAESAANTSEFNKPSADSTNSGSSTNSAESTADISKLENLPEGFKYIGSVPLNAADIKIDYNAENISEVVGGYEGMYKYNESDFYIDVIELENSEVTTNLIDAYKSSFKPLTEGSRFADESFNGHSAVRIADHVTSAGTEIPRYTYIWGSGNHVFVVTGSTADASLVKKLAEATGY